MEEIKEKNREGSKEKEDVDSKNIIGNSRINT